MLKITKMIVVVLIIATLTGASLATEKAADDIYKSIAVSASFTTGAATSPAYPLPYMKDLPADYTERLRKALNVMSDRLETFNGTNWTRQPVVLVQSAIASFVLGRHVDNVNKYCESDACKFEILRGLGFRLFSTKYIRFYAMYNNRTGIIKGLLTPAAEKKFEEYLWESTKTTGKLTDAQRDVWDSHGGENGQVTSNVGHLLAAQLLKDHPDYANLKYNDGSTAKEQYDARVAYMSKWIDSRVKRGQFKEYGASYAKYTITALLNLRDFVEDPTLRKKTEMFLDLAFASMAEEILRTQRGGPKHRSKDESYTFKFYDLFFDAPGGTIQKSEYVDSILPTSNYYPPQPVASLARDINNRGNYSFAKRTPAKTIHGSYEARWERAQGEPLSVWRKLDKDHTITLEGFATASYIMGSHRMDTTVKEEDLRQQRWEGIVFANDPMARICIDGKNDELGGKYISNPLKTIQDRNVMVTMKWGTDIDKGVDPHLRIEFYHSLDAVEEDNGWIFVKSGDAFTAVKVVEGGYKWNSPWAHLDKFNPQEISYVTLNSEFSPIIFVVNDAADYNNDFAAFKTALKAEPITYKGGVLKFATITHEGLKKPGKINGKDVDLYPSRVFDSPFIRSDVDSGVVYIRKGDDAMILDFSDPENPKKILGVKPDERFPAGTGNAKPIILGKGTQ